MTEESEEGQNQREVTVKRPLVDIVYTDIFEEIVKDQDTVHSFADALEEQMKGIELEQYNLHNVI